MGIRDWLGSRSNKRAVAAGPSDEHPTALSAIGALMRAHVEAGDDGMWTTLTGAGNGKKALIEVAGEDINFCTLEVDLPALLRQSDLAAMAEGAHAGGRKHDDKSLWTIPGATPEQLALIIDAAFAGPCGLGPAYSVEGERHD